MMAAMRRWVGTSVGLAIVTALAPARADDPQAPPPPPAGVEAAAAPEAPASPDAEVRALRERVEQLEEDLAHTDQRVDRLAPLAARLSGYLDVGFFAVGGDGSGIRPDLGYAVHPEYRGIVPDSWVFRGDPLSTAINARGEPASTADSRAIVLDAIDTPGPTFIVNTLSVGLLAEVGARTLVTARLDFIPRSRDVSSPAGVALGDYLDVPLAYAEHRSSRRGLELALTAGKLDPVIGLEYRTREAPSRIEVTPSLLCRYTCGAPLGLKARAVLGGGAASLAVALTNGSSFTDGFPFRDEVDSNAMKTASARVAIAPRLAGGLELGASGAFGAQDLQDRDSVYQWLAGADLHLHRDDLVLRAEYVQGRAQGRSEVGAPPCGLAPCLRFKAAYGLAGYRITNVLMPYLRVDWRDALHRSGASFVYLSELLRATAGVRLALTANVVLKAEYTYNRELGRGPQFANDVLTSSLVLTY
jgi:hypothetical protein